MLTGIQGLDITFKSVTDYITLKQCTENKVTECGIGFDITTCLIMDFEGSTDDCHQYQFSQ